MTTDLGSPMSPHALLRKLLLFVLSLCFSVMAWAQTATVSLQGAHGKYLVAEPSGMAYANRPSVGSWETFTMVTNADQTVSFRSAHGKWLVAEADGGVKANRDTAGPWERFILSRNADSTVSFKTAHGKYLVTEPNGSILGNRLSVGPWERFRLAAAVAGATAGSTGPRTATGIGGGTTTGASAGPLTPAQLDRIVTWMAREKQVYDTPVCWKSSYDRGIGIAPAVCAPGQVNNAGLCYDVCRSGYGDNGTATCLQGCPSGYSDRGLLCHFDGPASYSPVHWDNCAYKTSRICAPDWLGGGSCTGGDCMGRLAEDNCRSGYNKSGSVCWKSLPSGMGGSAADPVKNTYSRTGSRGSCGSDRNDEVGLCYLKPRTGTSCLLTNCTQNCAPGTMSCGTSTCAKDEESCGQAIADMVVSPALMLANFVTMGSAKTAGAAAKAGAQAAEVGAKASMKSMAKAGVENGANANAVVGMMRDAVEKLALIGESDIAALSTDEVAAEIEKRYANGSPGYKSIGRRWAHVVAAIWAKEQGIELQKFVVGLADPTGIFGTINAFAKPQCQQHPAFPSL